MQMDIRRRKTDGPAAPVAVRDASAHAIAAPQQCLRRLEVTLLQADYSEWFEWSLSGPGGSLGMDAFTPNPWVGPVNELLGSWAVDASTVGMFSFTSTNYPAHPHVAQDYSVEFLFTPTLTNPGGGLEGLIHTPASPVPVPAAVWLFGSSMLGLASMARRKKSR